MIVAINTGFGLPVPAAARATQRALGLRARAEIAPMATDVGVLDILRSLGPDPLILLLGGALAGTTAPAEVVRHALRVVRIAKAQALAISLEIGNEPDLAGVTAADWAATCRAVLAAVRAAGFIGPVYGGSVSNLTRKALDYLAAMRWETLPSDLDVAVHRYAPRNDPKRSHSVSRQAEYAAVQRLVGARAIAVTEMGYHTAREGWGWFTRQLTDDQVAAALVRDLTELQQWGCVLAAVYQWQDGPTARIEDRWGVVRDDGTVKSQGLALQVFIAPVSETIRIHCTTTGPVTVPPLLTVDNGHHFAAAPDPVIPFRVTFTLPATEPPHGYRYDWPGHTFRPLTPLPGPGDHEGPVLDYAPPFIPLSPLVREGRFLRRADGGLWTAVEASDFNLLNRSLAGEDIEPLLRQRANVVAPGVGFTLLRVWTAYSIDRIGRLIPRERPGLYAHIPVFLRQCARHGLYVELTAFTGPYGGIFDTDDEKVAHWEAVKTAARGETNVLLELVNEADNGPNLGLPFSRLLDDAGVTCSHGSNSQDARPVEPFWDYATYRPAPGQWQRKVGHNAMEIWDGPTISNETPRCPDNERLPLHFHDAMAAATLLCAGACFHSVHGKTSDLFDAVELSCAQAWVQGARSVDLAQRAFGYIHRSDLETPDIIRAYQRGTAVVLIHA